MRGMPSQETIDAALAGDGDARELIAQRALDLSLRTAMALLGRRDLAAEVAQEAALNVMLRLCGLRSSAAFDAWVHRIALRESVRQASNHARRDARERPTDIELLGEVPETAITEHEAHARLAIADALRTLPRRQRAAVVLRYVHDLSDEQIADALDCRVGTVHALLSRARAQLRDHDDVQMLAPTHARS